MCIKGRNCHATRTYIITNHSCSDRHCSWPIGRAFVPGNYPQLMYCQWNVLDGQQSLPLRLSIVFFVSSLQRPRKKAFILLQIIHNQVRTEKICQLKIVVIVELLAYDRKKERVRGLS